MKRSRLSRCVTVSLVLTIAPLAACGAEDDGEDRADTIESTTSTTAQEDTPTTEEAAVDPNAALLALEDVPTGYTTAPNEDDEDPPGLCDQLQALDVENNDPVAEAEVTFSGGQAGPLINHQVTVLAEDVAERRFEEVRSALDEPACQTFTDETEDGQTATFTLAPLSAPRLGDETLALRMTGDENAYSATFDLVVERIGDTVSFLGVASVPVLGGPAPALDPLIRKADEKLRAA